MSAYDPKRTFRDARALPEAQRRITWSPNPNEKMVNRVGRHMRSSPLADDCCHASPTPPHPRRGPARWTENNWAPTRLLGSRIDNKAPHPTVDQSRRRGVKSLSSSSRHPGAAVARKTRNWSSAGPSRHHSYVGKVMSAISADIPISLDFF